MDRGDSFAYWPSKRSGSCVGQEAAGVGVGEEDVREEHRARGWEARAHGCLTLYSPDDALDTFFDLTRRSGATSVVVSSYPGLARVQAEVRIVSPEGLR